MRRSRTAVLFLFVTAMCWAEQSSRPGIDWPSFRGANASGVSEGYPLPVTWDVQKGENVLWKTPIPGLGLSSPIVWRDRIFLSTAISGEQTPDLKPGLYGDIGSVDDGSTHRWIVCCIDKRTGRVAWERTARTGIPKIKRHPKSTHANSTLATDGEHVVAFFGSEGLFCYDLNGKLLWSKDLGVLDSAFYVAPEAQWEFASSPIIHSGAVIVQCDVLKNSFLAAFRIKDGSEIWRTVRDDVPSWSTPSIYGSGGEAQVVVNGFRHIGGYDANTGKELWRMQGGGDIPVPAPIVAAGVGYITGAHGPLAPVYAIRLSARGDVSLQPNQTSNDGVIWMNKEGSYMATPLLYGDHLYNCRWNGVFCCYDPKTGNRLYQQRVGAGAFTASPVAGDGKIFVASEDGDVYVIKAGPAYELLAKNSLGEVCLATPALSEGKLLIRTQRNLLAIAAGK
jgi:outer membrane protein assembly factor BamB